MAQYGSYFTPSEGYYGQFGSQQKDRDIAANQMNYQAQVDEGYANRKSTEEMTAANLAEQQRQFNDALAWQKEVYANENPLSTLSEEQQQFAYRSSGGRSSSNTIDQQRQQDFDNQYKMFTDELNFRRDVYEDELGQRKQDRMTQAQQYLRQQQQMNIQAEYDWRDRQAQLNFAGESRDLDYDFKREGLEAQKDMFGMELDVKREGLEGQLELGREANEIQRYGIDKQFSLGELELAQKDDSLKLQQQSLEYQYELGNRQLDLSEQELGSQQSQFDSNLDLQRYNIDAQTNLNDNQLSEQQRQFDLSYGLQQDQVGYDQSQQDWTNAMKESQYLNTLMGKGFTDQFGRSWLDRTPEALPDHMQYGWR